MEINETLLRNLEGEARYRDPSSGLLALSLGDKEGAFLFSERHKTGGVRWLR
jgi:hypothetical protein